ncbi:MAG: hypothetical protein J0L92_08560 [Deltaproteobacteria bacterium]|nr:hypothetical protein [Deltaproteobacteria bacterium]
MRVSGSFVVSGAVSALVVLGAGASGCTCDGPVDMMEVDAARGPRVDADLDAPGEDTAAEGQDAFAIREDANLDTGPSTGFDSGPGSALDCRHSHAFGEDFWYLARDSDDSVPSFTSVASRAGNLVGVYSTTDGAGARHLEAFRYRIGVGGMDPTVLAEGAGGALPTVVASSDGFWVAYTVGSDIRVARYGDDLSARGPAATVATEAVTTPPRIATTGTGGYVVWVVGNTIRGRPLDAAGAPTGMATTLVTSARPVQQVAIQRVGPGADLALAWADDDRPHLARFSGGAVGTAEFVGGDPGIFTSIDMGGQSAGTMEGLPLAGAAVYDLNDGGARDIVFRVVNDAIVPSFPAATVASGGDHAWSGSVEPFLSGYALAYRASLPALDRTALRIGYLDRDGCRLGSVTDRYIIGLIDSESGAVPQLAVDEGTMLIVWSDERAGEYFDYWAAVMVCTERS